MRIDSVSRPLSTTQALNGDSSCRRCASSGTSLASISSVGPHTAPAITRPWPSRYLVPAVHDQVGAQLHRRCSAGEQKQLSTASSAPAPCAMSASARMSQTSVSGLVGVSANSSLVFGLQRRAPLGRRRSATRSWSRRRTCAKSWQQLDGGAEHALRADHVVAGLQQAHDQQQDGRHAAGGGDAAARCLPAPPGGAPSSSPWGW